MVDESAAIAAILVMMTVTLATRFGGVWIMSFVEITPRIQAFLRYVATSVLISIVVPATLFGPPRMWFAAAAAGIAMIATGRALWAMLIGAALAALARALGL